MSENDDPPDSEVYGDVRIDARGRLTLPKALREDLRLEGETSITVVREGADIRLVRETPELRTLSTEKPLEEWDGDAFRDAGDATFRDR